MNEISSGAGSEKVWSGDPGTSGIDPGIGGTGAAQYSAEEGFKYGVSAKTRKS